MGRAGFAAGVGDGGDQPLAVLADEREEVRAAVVFLAVDEDIEGRPDDGEVMIDADEGLVDALLDTRGGWLGDALGEGLEGHLQGLAFAHEGERSAREERRADGGGIAVGHAIEESVNRREDGLLLVGRSGCVQSGAEGGEEKERAERLGHGGHSSPSR